MIGFPLYWLFSGGYVCVCGMKLWPPWEPEHRWTEDELARFGEAQRPDEEDPTFVIRKEFEHRIFDARRRANVPTSKTYNGEDSIYCIDRHLRHQYPKISQSATAPRT